MKRDERARERVRRERGGGERREREKGKYIKGNLDGQPRGCRLASMTEKGDIN